MTVLRAALLFDHPTTRLFASRILESFFFSFFASSSSSFSTTSACPFLRIPSPRASLVLFCYSLSVSAPLFSLPFFSQGPVSSFRASRLPSRSSVNKRTRKRKKNRRSLPPCLLVPYFFFLFFLFLVSSPSTADFRKVKRVATMGKAACPLTDGNGIIRPCKSSAVASHAKSVADCRNIICTSAFHSFARGANFHKILMQIQPYFFTFYTLLCKSLIYPTALCARYNNHVKTFLSDMT